MLLHFIRAKIKTICKANAPKEAREGTVGMVTSLSFASTENHQ
jgi:hypothetical protein